MAPTSAPGGLAGAGVGLVLLNKAGCSVVPTARIPLVGCHGVFPSCPRLYVAMVDLLLKDLSGEMTEKQVFEMQAQEGYVRCDPGVHVRS